MSRKTIDVAAVKAKVNHMLKESAGDQIVGREALIVLIEAVLMDSGNYRGFAFLPEQLGDDGLLNEHADQTRRRYF